MLSRGCGHPATLIFYESPHRIGRSLADCLDILVTKCSVSRELTKIHEETLTGSLSSILERILSANSRGEYVLIIDRERDGQEVRPVSSSLQERVAELEAAGHDNRAALKIAAKEHGLSRSEAYRQLQLSRPGDIRRSAGTFRKFGVKIPENNGTARQPFGNIRILKVAMKI